MHYDIATFSNIGKRDINEDSLFAKSYGDRVIAIVADGVGGLDHGEIASEMAVCEFQKSLENTSAFSEDILIEVFESVNRKIRLAQKDGAMRTTASVAMIQSGKVVLGYVGDTRIYVFRNSAVAYQTIDHSVAQLHVYAGKLSVEDIRGSRLRNRLTRAMGGSERIIPDVATLQLQPGDRVLICTDGFWEPLPEKIMISTISDNQTAREWMNNISKRIENIGNPRQDNYSAVAILVSG